MEGLEGVTYRKRLEELLTTAPLSSDKALQNIRAGKSVTAEDLKRLQQQIRAEAPDVDLDKLTHLYPKAKDHLDLALRMVVGLDAEAVEERFTEFAGAHGGLNSDQQRFLAILKKQLADFGAIDPDRLDEAPFTSLHEDGIYGIFEEDAQREELFHLVASFSEPDTNRA